jgi:hypothetical protein
MQQRVIWKQNLNTGLSGNHINSSYEKNGESYVRRQTNTGYHGDPEAVSDQHGRRILANWQGV